MLNINSGLKEKLLWGLKIRLDFWYIRKQEDFFFFSEKENVLTPLNYSRNFCLITVFLNLNNSIFKT